MSEISDGVFQRVVVVTGSGKWIGKAIATRFAKAGYKVMLNDLEKEKDLEDTKEEISKMVNDNDMIGYVVGDVSDEQVSTTLMEQTVSKFGRIDVLVNNSSIAEKVATKKEDEISKTAQNSYYEQVCPYFTLEEYEVADAYLRGAYLCIKEAVKRMSSTVGDWNSRHEGICSIINVSSPYDSIAKDEAEAFTFSMSGVNPFTASRAGIETLTKTIALQLADTRIRVNAILPGVISTGTMDNESRPGSVLAQKMREKEKKIPFHRMGRPEEVSEIALFLASERASYITGSMIYADGGLSLTSSNYFLENRIEQD
jgi:NAD(P)-dependent dehydrogenase (short-subunit alcohol dehydrogenase family)